MTQSLLPPALKDALLQLGLEQPIFSRIRAGRNSRVWRVESTGRIVVGKEYFQGVGDTRDRLGVEFQFLDFLWKNGVRNIPEPLVTIPECNTGIFSHVSGKRVEQASPEAVEQTAFFIQDIQDCTTSPEARALPLASEACLCLEDHASHAARRLELLAALESGGEDHECCIAFVKETLQPVFTKARKFFEKRFDAAERSKPLALDEMILSPSDFGFHNALQVEQRLFFLDFEYAGWDDPAKLVCDFICQPEVSVSSDIALIFHDILFPGAVGARMAEKVRYLLPLCHVKWCCILLNEFLDCARARRRHACDAEGISLQNQLAKAQRYYEQHLEGY